VDLTGLTNVELPVGFGNRVTTVSVIRHEENGESPRLDDPFATRSPAPTPERSVAQPVRSFLETGSLLTIKRSLNSPN